MCSVLRVQADSDVGLRVRGFDVNSDHGIFSSSGYQMINYLLTAFIGLCSTVVIYGWINNIDVVKSVIPGSVTMKITTAVCFGLTAIMLGGILVSRECKCVMAKVAVTTSAMWILFLMLGFLNSSLFNAPAQLEQLFIIEKQNAVMSYLPGYPSLMTAFNFVLLGVAGVVVVFNTIHMAGRLRWISWFVMASSLVAFLGHVFNQPWMYYYFEGKSTAMAIHTSFLFICSAFVLLRVCRAEKMKRDRK
jgi:hypothetical protein